MVCPAYSSDASPNVALKSKWLLSCRLLRVTEARVQLLGAARVRVGLQAINFLDDKRFALLAHLACKNDWVAREQLAFLFWPDTDSSAARKNLRHLISAHTRLSLAARL